MGAYGALTWGLVRRPRRPGRLNSEPTALVHVLDIEHRHNAEPALAYGRTLCGLRGSVLNREDTTAASLRMAFNLNRARGVADGLCNRCQAAVVKSAAATPTR